MSLTTAADAKTQQQAVIADLIANGGPAILDYANKRIQDAISVGQNKCNIYLETATLTSYLVDQLTTAGYRVEQSSDGTSLLVIWE